MPESVRPNFTLQIERTENGMLAMRWGGNLTPSEVCWVLDELKMKLHQNNSVVPSIPGLNPKRA